jgi:hypothetical protein
MQVDPSTDLNRAPRDYRFRLRLAKAQLRWRALKAARINQRYIDNIVNAAKTRGVKLLSIVTAPAWSRPTNTDFSVPALRPIHRTTLTSSALLRALCERVDAIEVERAESMVRVGGAGKMNAGEYVALLKWLTRDQV